MSFGLRLHNFCQSRQWVWEAPALQIGTCSAAPASSPAVSVRLGAIVREPKVFPADDRSP